MSSFLSKRICPIGFIGRGTLLGSKRALFSFLGSSLSFTLLLVWDILLTHRSIHMVFSSSEKSKSHFVISLASCTSPGSNSGRPSHLAAGRVSSSLGLFIPLGSSQPTRTSPPTTSLMTPVPSMSQITATPFCFMETRARILVKEAPVAACIATSSFTDHSA